MTAGGSWSCFFRRFAIFCSHFDSFIPRLAFKAHSANRNSFAKIGGSQFDEPDLSLANVIEKMRARELFFERNDRILSRPTKRRALLHGLLA